MTHISFDETKKHGRELRAALQWLEEGYEALSDLKTVMTHMIDGDGSSATHFAVVTSRFGFTDNNVSKAAWDEINSLLGKLNTDGSVTFVNAALLQVFAKFG